tara:strand:- start:564 stop:1283 length:720 start_codon:yes stop_codon:yes gene_type:complete
MKKIYITGASKGLGKALAEAYLKEGHSVIGMSRTKSVEHKNYQHIEIDLSDADALTAFSFDLSDQFEEYILINNAGSLGEIKPLGNWTVKGLSALYQLNVVTPMFLTNQFYKASCNSDKFKYVLHIGSGAANSPIDGWAQYCSSKAALHMASQVIEEELKLKSKENFKQRTLSPGVIDTQMQEQIRNIRTSDFSQKERFVAYKNNNELASAENLADKIIRNFINLFEQEGSIQYLRNYS